jgi:hypothetical protein
MEATSITINDRGVRLSGNLSRLWLTDWQIAKLFGVFTIKVSSNLRAMFKTRILDEAKVCQQQSQINGSITTLYNFEAIAALAFRIESREAKLFREWLFRRMAVHETKIWYMPLFRANLN